jgi:hypothetical protein
MLDKNKHFLNYRRVAVVIFTLHTFCHADHQHCRECWRRQRKEILRLSRKITSQPLDGVREENFITKVDTLDAIANVRLFSSRTSHNECRAYFYVKLIYYFIRCHLTTEWEEVENKSRLKTRRGSARRRRRYKMRKEFI